ncbi:MAG: hypothetical protein SPI30_02605 [Prevotella sp.]|nr:hypothetical protein [Prevotella sp.]
MRRILFLTVCLLMQLVAFAQTNPNRMIVQPKVGEIKGFLVERIDSVYFTKLEGRVAADVQFKKFKTGNADTIMLSVTKTENCRGFRIECVSGVLANALNSDAAVASYLERANAPLYYDDFTNAEMTGFEFKFKPNSEYTLLTIGYDQYGIACSASRASFTTPANPVIGNPSVAWKLDEVGYDNLTMTFTPNEDCASYAICLFKLGEAQKQFEMWGPMMGFANIGDMVKQFSGNAYTETYTNKWTRLEPGTDYEVYILPMDANGTYADMVIAPAKTNTMGGEGVAEMTITIGEFGGEPGAYYQDVTYTPNDQVALHRDMIIVKSAYESEQWGETGVLNYLKEDRPMDPYWNQYGVDNARWNADPSTEYIAFSIAQNAKGEWGPLARKDFSTPAAPAGVKAYGKELSSRVPVAGGQNAVSPFRLNGKDFTRGLRIVQK